MYLINTSFHIHEPISAEVVSAIREELIPAVRRSGLFGEPQFLRIMLEIDPSLRAYSLQMTANDPESAMAWLEGEGGTFFQRLTQSYGERLVYFTTPMKVL